MKLLRTLFLICLFFCLIIFQSFCIDFGAVIDNATGLSVAEETSFTQQDKLSLWLDSTLGEKLDFSLMASYTFTLERPYLFDLETLRLGGKFPSVNEGPSLFIFNIGRFSFSDFTGYILDHSADGLQLGFNYPKALISISAGYTGLHLKPSSNIIISRADSSDMTDNAVFFAPPRLIGGMEFLFPELFARQSLAVSILFQEDLRVGETIIEEGETVQDPGRGGLLDTQYFGLGLKGLIVPFLYYDSFFFLETGKTLSYIDGSYQYKPILSLMFGGGVRYYLEKFLFSSFALKFVFSGGDSDHDSSFIEANTADSSTSFIPVSRPDLSLVLSPQLSNIFLVELGYSLKPLSWTESLTLDKLQTVFKVIGFFRSSTGPISEPGIDPVSDSLYLGTEIDGIINFRPLSDLALALSTGVFIPGSAAFLDNRETANFLCRIEFSFSF